jgi:hypothetical protein
MLSFHVLLFRPTLKQNGHCKSEWLLLLLAVQGQGSDGGRIGFNTDT